MEVTSESFSIREYTSKMRANNTGKCWPFDGNPNEMKKELVEDFLPPITIKKYKWWFTELEKVVSESKESGFGKAEVGKVVLVDEEEIMVINCPVCLSFTASSVKIMGVHIDSCLALRKKQKNNGMGVKEKSKQPKKRSMVEIIAVAPQIEDMAFEEEDDDDDDDEEDMFKQENIKLFDIIANAKRKRKLKRRDVVGMVKNLKNASKKRTCAKKGNSLLKSQEITHKSKGPIQLGLIHKLKAPSIGKKLTSNTKSSRKTNVLKTVRATRKPVHGILKKYPTVNDETFEVGSTMGGNQTTQCHQIDKRVRFSVNHHPEKANNGSPARKEKPTVNGMGSSTEHVISVTPGPQIHSVNEKGGLNANDGHMVVPNLWTSSDRRHDGQPSLPTVESSGNRFHEELGQGLAHGSVRLTGDFQPQEDLHLLGHSKSLSSHYSTSGMTQDCYSVQPGAKHLSDIHGVPIPSSAAMGSTTSEFLNSSFPKRREADERYQFVSQDASQNIKSCGFQYQTILELAPKDVRTSICSLVCPKPRKAAVCESNYLDDDFIGLPLNSHGELIKSYSSGKGGLNQRRKQSMINAVSNFPSQNFVGLGSTSDHLGKNKSCYVETALPKEKFKLFMGQDSLENCDRASKLSTTGLQGTRGIDVLQNETIKGKNQSVHQLGLDMNQMNISNCGCSRYTKNTNQTVQENIVREDNSESGFFPSKQPTMRLMGKDVTVGRNRKEVQGSGDGEEWTDKSVIKEHLPTALIEKSSMSTNFQIDTFSFGKLKEPGSQSLRFQENPTRPYFSQMNTIDSRYSQSYYNSQPNIMPQSGMLLTPLPSEELMSRTLRMPRSFNYGAESPNLSSQIHLQTYSQYPSQYMRLNPTQLLYNQGQSHRSSGSQFPFASQNCGQCDQPSQPQLSPEGLTYWMLNASQQRENLSFPSECDIIAQNLQHNTPGNFSAISSPYITSMISQPNHYVKHPPRALDSSGTNLFQRPLLPVPPGFRPNSSINSNYRSMFNLKDRIKPQIVRRQDPDKAKRIKERHAHKRDASVKYSKKSREVPLHSNNPVEIGNEVNLSGFSIHNTKAPEIDTEMEKERYVDHSQMVTYGDALKSSAAVNSSNTDDVARSGPLKLSAGAKHILKPSPNTDHENSRPMHSTIPFGSVSSSNKLVETQKKPSKIYTL